MNTTNNRNNQKRVSATEFDNLASTNVTAQTTPYQTGEVRGNGEPAQARQQQKDETKNGDNSERLRKPATASVSPLRSGNFILLIAGQGLSLFGNTMLRFAMSMWVLDKTGSATIFATLLSISIIPTILLMPFGGVIADRVNRRTMMVALDAISGCVVLAATLAFGFMETHTIISIAVLLIALSALDALESPTVSAAIPQMLGRKDAVLLRRAQAISSQVNSIMQIIPTFAGGALYALIGIRTMMGATTLCFFATAGLECFIKLEAVHHHETINENKNKPSPDEQTKPRRKRKTETISRNGTAPKGIRLESTASPVATVPDDSVRPYETLKANRNKSTFDEQIGLRNVTKAETTETVETVAKEGCPEPAILTFRVTAGPDDSELSESQNNKPAAHTGIIKVFLADIRDAAAFLKANPTLLELLAVTAALNFFLNGVSSVGSPYIIRTALGFGADIYGYSDGIMSIVSLLDTLLTTALAAKLFMRQMPATIYAAALCFAPITVIFALPMSRWMKLVTFIAAFCLITLSIDFTNIIISPTFLMLIPDELMGKIGAFISTISLCATPLGQMVYGLLFDRMAVAPIMAGTGICLAIGALVLTPMCKRFGHEESTQQ
ncbi:MFS transporter [Bifidobacterium sp. ESL0745]|uniref:MFS transporter n=1 Tax=Bifidobacterium sp. ESL0745 TaxID=2983226 RepID=UPI0023FA291E|nr:MFS transporter [Bifidobacterium sp. ESL0745]MDF7666084.1 MFS transporter [Bifidobacterium sp. ESL0745]